MNQLHAIFNKVFCTTDPFSEMFADSIKHKIVLCPTDNYKLDQEQFNALISAAKFVGDDKFYLSEIEGSSFETEESNDTKYDFGHWEATCETQYEEYLRALVVLENALYSSCARWGVIISHESHAVVGGDEKFIEMFKEVYPSWKDSLRNFIEQWEYNRKNYNSNVEWLPSFISFLKND
ncbi:hypothetical protein [Paenibacillus taiwanensis]|uniref:hypothetical protein n=1 Tax=Paenibacillus taiwanensis TaxID=401638 RepID=UPI001B7FD017|nr:hypothetical protein [Paenibacillus taiwanensis]